MKGERRPTTKVYLLQHVHSLDDGEDDVKIIGVYSSRDNAEAAIMRLQRSPGFTDAPDGFHIDEYHVDKEQWVGGVTTDTNA